MSFQSDFKFVTKMTMSNIRSSVIN